VKSARPVPWGAGGATPQSTLRMLALRHLVTRSGGLYSADPADLPLLACYANSIASRRVRAG